MNLTPETLIAQSNCNHAKFKNPQIDIDKHQLPSETSPRMSEVSQNFGEQLITTILILQGEVAENQGEID